MAYGPCRFSLPAPCGGSGAAAFLGYYQRRRAHIFGRGYIRRIPNLARGAGKLTARTMKAHGAGTAGSDLIQAIQ